MRKGITICLFLISFTLNMQGQSYDPVCKIQSTSWNFIPQGGCDAIYTDSIIIIDDTVFNLQKYYVLYRYGYLQDDTAGYLREDTIAGKLWYTSNLQTATEYLVMDLSLQKNDHFIVYGFVGSFQITVDSVYLDINNRKHIDFGYGNLTLCSYNPKFEFIEGVGPTSGVFFQGQASGSAIYSALLCCHKDNLQIFSNPTFSDRCKVNEVGIKENNPIKLLIISPNPANTSITLSMPQLTADAEVCIFNCMGLPVMKLRATKANEKIVFNIETLPNGIYFVKFQNYSGKFVKQN
jgi:hypothetical protein